MSVRDTMLARVAAGASSLTSIPTSPPDWARALVYVGDGEAGGLSWEAVSYLQAFLRECGGESDVAAPQAATNGVAACSDVTAPPDVAAHPSVTAPPAGAVAGWDLPPAVSAALETALEGQLRLVPVEAWGEISETGRRVPIVVAANRAREAARWLRSADLPLVPEHVDLVREAVVYELGLLYDLTAILRRDCPWDRAQTQASIVRYTLEETYELVDAVAQTAGFAPGASGGERDVAGELGDLLFQVYFLAVVAQEEERYDLGEVAAGIRRKLVRRHPHIFADTEAATPEEVKRNWDQIKRHTEGRTGVFHEVPDSLPSTLLAQKLQARAAEVGFDWPDAEGPLQKISEELEELKGELEAPAAAAGRRGGGGGPRATGAVAAEVGDLLFAVVNVARKLKVDPELALRSASGRFRERVERAVELAEADGRSWAELELDDQEAYYQRAKAETIDRGQPTA